MISHGLISAALFASVGVVYDRLHSRMIRIYGGLYSNTLFLIFALLLYYLRPILGVCLSRAFRAFFSSKWCNSLVSCCMLWLTKGYFWCYK